MEIKNHTALVTGGASGLGAATVRRIVACGGKAAIIDVQKEKGRAPFAERARRGRLAAMSVKVRLAPRDFGGLASNRF
jgi:NAD(P)-dependent dehydrogenase (short-subunit alcohol dehydrogenase family)